MEDTIGSKFQSSFEQIFRITYKQNDYFIKLIGGIPAKNQTEISILLDGSVQTLLKKGEKWCFKDVNSDHEYANDIGRAIALRFRI